MKRLVLLLLVIVASPAIAQNVGIGTATPMTKLHVAGGVRANQLASPANNVVQVAPNGQLQEIGEGNVGEVLTQTSSGPQFKTLPAGDSNNCRGGCAGEFALDASGNRPPGLSAGNFANCSRQCEGLTFDGHSDWRLPTIDEAAILIGKTTASSDVLWTSSVANTDAKWYVMGLQDGKLEVQNGDNTFQCYCVR